MSKEPGQFLEQVHRKLEYLSKTQPEMRGIERDLLLKQLNDFHDYYNNRYQQLKEHTEKITKQNWDYVAIDQHQANQILRYQAKFQQFQKAFEQSNKRAQELQLQLVQINRSNDDSEEEKRKQIEIREKKNYQNKRKMVLKSKESDSRWNLKDKYDRKEDCKYDYTQIGEDNELLKRQIQILKKKVKHFELDKQYEEDRLKHAILSVELELQIKNQQITRLNNQISIYQQKFQQLLQQPLLTESQIFTIPKYFKGAKTPNKKNNPQFLDIKESILKQNDSINISHKLSGNQSEDTQKKVHIGYVKTHRRNLSSNLQSKESKPFDMKIQVYRFDKNNKKSFNV